MREDAFRSWLLDVYRTSDGRSLELSTVNSRVANCRNVEKYEGDLDSLFDQDQFECLLNSLTYTREDERRSRPARHRVPILGNIYNGTATLKAAVTLYEKFRGGQSNGNAARRPRLVRAAAASGLTEDDRLAEKRARDTTQPSERHFTIADGATGYSYESLVGPYMHGANEVTVQDPYIRTRNQVQNFIRFCEALTRLGKVRRIKLVTSFGHDPSHQRAEENLSEIKRSLRDRGVVLDLQQDGRKHDREIRFDNGWVIRIGRGLDFYQPCGQFEIGSLDLSLRRCRETNVDIFRL